MIEFDIYCSSVRVAKRIENSNSAIEKIFVNSWHKTDELIHLNNKIQYL